MAELPHSDAIYRSIVGPSNSYTQQQAEEMIARNGPGPTADWGIFGAPAGGLTSRSVTTVPIDNYGNPILAQQKANAVAQALSLGRANGKGTGGGVAAALAGVHQPAGSVLTGKDPSRLASGPVGWDPTYGYAPMPKPSSALAAIETVAPAPTVGLPRRRPNIEANPGTLVPTRASDGGVFGVPVSGGMNRNIAGRTAMSGVPGIPQRAPVPITVRGGNKTQQALAQVAQASAPAPAPVQPTVQATQWQQDRFQTTEGAGLPSSMGSSRWTTGY